MPNRVARVLWVLVLALMGGGAVGTDSLSAAGAPKAYVGLFKDNAVAVLDTEDEKGTDAKLLAVPVDKVSNFAYDNLRDLADVPERTKNEIYHFYNSYKALEKGKWVKITGWRDAAAARAEIENGIKAYTGK